MQTANIVNTLYEAMQKSIQNTLNFPIIVDYWTSKFRYATKMDFRRQHRTLTAKNWRTVRCLVAAKRPIIRKLFNIDKKLSKHHLQVGVELSTDLFSSLEALLFLYYSRIMDLSRIT